MIDSAFHAGSPAEGADGAERDVVLDRLDGWRRAAGIEEHAYRRAADAWCDRTQGLNGEVAHLAVGSAAFRVLFAVQSGHLKQLAVAESPDRLHLVGDLTTDGDAVFRDHQRPDRIAGGRVVAPAAEQIVLRQCANRRTDQRGDRQGNDKAQIHRGNLALATTQLLKSASVAALRLSGMPPLWQCCAAVAQSLRAMAAFMPA